MSEIDKTVERIGGVLQGTDLKQSRFHRRLRDFQALDRVTIEILPRYKTSGMSGDEWRQSVKVTGYFKGLEVFGFVCGRDMETAFAMLPGKVIEWGDNPVSNNFLAVEAECCDQPSCRNKWTKEYEIGKLAARDGSWLDPAEKYFVYYRRFCNEHATRGDCSREDADDNYTLSASR